VRFVDAVNCENVYKCALVYRSMTS